MIVGRVPGAPGLAGFCETWEWLRPLRPSWVLPFFFVISAHASWMWSSPRSRNSGETWGTRPFLGANPNASYVGNV